MFEAADTSEAVRGAAQAIEGVAHLVFGLAVMKGQFFALRDVSQSAVCQILEAYVPVGATGMVETKRSFG
jgi:hypothetical protein